MYKRQADPAAEGLTLESSMDGKTWTAYAGEEVPEAAFVRVKNNTSEAIALGADTLTWSLRPIAEFVGASCSVELYQPANYPLSNLTDGNYDTKMWTCLLYTSDAADDLLCVDLGGRRTLQKKKKKK